MTWINIDDPPHQFRVEGAEVKTEYLLKGQTGTVVLKEPGVYHYGDTFYPGVESLSEVSLKCGSDHPESDCHAAQRVFVVLLLVA